MPITIATNTRIDTSATRIADGWQAEPRPNYKFQRTSTLDLAIAIRNALGAQTVRFTLISPGSIEDGTFAEYTFQTQ